MSTGHSETTYSHGDYFSNQDNRLTEAEFRYAMDNGLFSNEKGTFTDREAFKGGTTDAWNFYDKMWNEAYNKGGLANYYSFDPFERQDIAGIKSKYADKVEQDRLAEEVKEREEASGAKEEAEALANAKGTAFNSTEASNVQNQGLTSSQAGLIQAQNDVVTESQNASAINSSLNAQNAQSQADYLAKLGYESNLQQQAGNLEQAGKYSTGAAILSGLSDERTKQPIDINEATLKNVNDYLALVKQLKKIKEQR